MAGTPGHRIVLGRVVPNEKLRGTRGFAPLTYGSRISLIIRYFSDFRRRTISTWLLDGRGKLKSKLTIDFIDDYRTASTASQAPSSAGMADQNGSSSSGMSARSVSGDWHRCRAASWMWVPERPQMTVKSANSGWPADKAERWPLARLASYEHNARMHSDEHSRRGTRLFFGHAPSAFRGIRGLGRRLAGRRG